MQRKQIEKRERNRKDREWSRLIKERDIKCIICGRNEFLNSHHLFPREIKELRYYLDNGVTLCRNCHKFSLKNSPHRNPLEFYLWLSKNRKNQLKRLCNYKVTNK